MNFNYLNPKGIISLIKCIVLVLAIFPFKLNSQNFEWSKRAGSYAFDEGDEVVVGKDGSIYVVGEIEITADFSSTYINVYGLHDIFIAKYSSNGTLLWVKKAGGVTGDAGKAIAIDENDNIYLTGEFEKESKFGDITLNGGTLNDIFVAKYDSNGNAIWAKKAGSGASDKGHGIAVDKQGNVYVTGEFKTTAYFGSKSISSSGDKDVFIAKYDNNGSLLWVKKAGGAQADEGRGIAIDEDGNAYLIGYFHNYIDFGGGNSLNGSGGYDIFIAKYNTNGDFIWAKKAGGQYYDIGRGIEVSNSGQIYITGEFIYKAYFDGIQITGSGSGDIFIASYDTNGNVKWVKKAGGSGDDRGRKIKMDKFGNLYITGEFSQTANFSGKTVSSSGDKDVFVASYTNSGEINWVMKGGGTEEDVGSGIALDKNSGKVYATGYFMNNATFGSTSFTAKDHTDIFITKIGQNVMSKPSVAASGAQVNRVGCDKVEISWTNGSGERRIVVASRNAPVSNLPSTGYNYEANSFFGDGGFLGADQYIVYKGYSNNTTVEGLKGGDYYFSIFEFNGTGYSSNYNTSEYPTTHIIVEEFSLLVNVTDTTICPGQQVNIITNGAENYLWFPAIHVNQTNEEHFILKPDISTIFTLIGTDSICSDTIQININVNNSSILELGSDTVLCANQFLILSAGDGFASYIWSNGSVSSSIIIDSSGIGFEPGYFSVTVADSLTGCSFVDTIMVLFDVCSSLDESIQDFNGINIFPNPSNGFVTINWSKVYSEKIVVKIYNQTGRLILLRELFTDESTNKINIEGLARGLYYFSISSGEKSLTEKVVIN